MSDARECGEELRAALVERLGRPVALFDNDPELDDYDPKYGAHLQAVGAETIVVVNVPNMVTNGRCFEGHWAGDNGYAEQMLRRDQVADYFADHLA